MEEGGDGYERYYEDYDEDMRLEVENFERYPEQEDREYSDIEDIILSYFEEGKQLIAKFHIHPVNDLVEALHKKLNLEKKYITFPSEDDVERTIKWRELLKKIYGYEFKPLEIIGSKINGKVEVNVFMINPEKINEYGSIPEASDNLSDYENGYAGMSLKDKRLAEERGIFSVVPVAILKETGEILLKIPAKFQRTQM